jgi:hypothetical protein
VGKVITGVGEGVGGFFGGFDGGGAVGATGVGNGAAVGDFGKGRERVSVIVFRKRPV